MTAAHCLENLTPAQFKYYVKVYVGVEDLTKAMYNSSKKYSVAQLIKHENFVMKTKHSDIALIKLDRAVATIDNDTMPACLPSRYVGAGKYEQVGSYERKVCYVGGWGHTREGGMIFELLYTDQRESYVAYKFGVHGVSQVAEYKKRFFDPYIVVSLFRNCQARICGFRYR